MYGTTDLYSPWHRIRRREKFCEICGTPLYQPTHTVSPTFGICQQRSRSVPTCRFTTPQRNCQQGCGKNHRKYYYRYSSSLQRNFLLSCQGTAIEIEEIRHFPKYFGTEYVEDFGYSHGSQLVFPYPGKSNAIDGYIVYEVPASFSAEKAYVEIVFNGKTTKYGTRLDDKEKIFLVFLNKHIVPCEKLQK